MEDWKAESVAKDGEVMVGVGVEMVILVMALVKGRRRGKERRREGGCGRSIAGEGGGGGGGGGGAGGWQTGGHHATQCSWVEGEGWETGLLLLAWRSQSVSTRECTCTQRQREYNSRRS